MAIYQALGTGPISFVDANGTQREMPLSQLFFTPNGWDATTAPLNMGADAAILSAIIPLMIAQGFLVPAGAAISASALPGLTIAAVQPGTAGDQITVAFANPVITGAQTIDVTVTVPSAQVFPGQTPSTLGAALAAEPNPLVALQAGADPAMPEAFTGSISGNPASTLAIAENATTTAFTLEATDTTNANGEVTLHVSVSLDLPAAVPPTFTVTVGWTKAVKQVNLASLATTNPFAQFVTFTGQSGPMPAAGAITLAGGTATAPAQANVLSST